MEEIYRTLNRLKTRGMKGWHATKQDWLVERLKGTIRKSLINFYRYFCIFRIITEEY